METKTLAISTLLLRRGRKMNRIKKLRREDGGVVVNGEELGSFITNNYKSLFLSSAGPEK
jgi:hypothetical protein